MEDVAHLRVHLGSPPLAHLVLLEGWVELGVLDHLARA